MSSSTELKLEFPLFTLAVQESSEEGQASFEEVRPKPGARPQKTVTGKPAWVKQLPKTKMVWGPIVLDGVVPLFGTEALAKMVVAEQKLQLVFGTIDFIALENPQDVLGWVKKSGKTSVKLHVLATPPQGGERVVATSEFDASAFEKSVEVESEE